MNITPTCRYDHGPLTELLDDPERRYVLRTIYKAEEPPGQSVITDSPMVFTLRLFRCAVCGYLELFDDEP